MYDLIIKNGSLIDGTGGAPFAADLAVSGGKIARIAPPARSCWDKWRDVE